ncbi:hypothetical protein AB0I77_26370 [Streptomyces sp. NPDC050619]|uniref:hypothetical protein n=1 Tax=Streptomyces sp. NPDC050619 TaxID=3157214 RepID=UPI003438A88D
MDTTRLHRRRREAWPVLGTALAGALVGSYCLTLVSRGVWELGYRAVKELRGRGYSVEAAPANVDRGVDWRFRRSR